MTVRVNKPTINVRETVSDQDKVTGIAGEAMLRANTTQEQFSLINAGRKNIIINGDFRVAQRGTAITSDEVIATSAYTVDRWVNYASYGSDTQSVRRNEVTLPNGQLTYSFKVTQNGTTNNTTFWHMIQPFEIDRWMKGQTFTASYWYRTNSESVQPRYCDGAGCWAVDKRLIADGQWHYVTWSFIITPTTTGHGQFHPAFTKMNGQKILGGEYFEFAEVQMELGEIATPFERRSYAEELLLCQRYYLRVGADGATTNLMVGGVEGAAYGAVGGFVFPTTMRAIPTISQSNTKFYSAASGGVSYTIGTNRCSREVGSFIAGGMSGLTPGQAATIYKDASSAYLEFSAEF